MRTPHKTKHNKLSYAICITLVYKLNIGWISPSYAVSVEKKNTVGHQIHFSQLPSHKFTMVCLRIGILILQSPLYNLNVKMSNCDWLVDCSRISLVFRLCDIPVLFARLTRNTRLATIHHWEVTYRTYANVHDVGLGMMWQKTSATSVVDVFL